MIKVQMVEMEADLNEDGPNLSMVWPMLDENVNNAPGRNDTLA